MMETAQKLSSASLPHPLERVGAGYTSYNSSAQLVSPSASATDQFPVGLRVLVVDDDTTCLRILEHMLRRCLYHVTTCCQAVAALKLLREKKGCFDLVISDVHMPDMDGFKLLEHVGLEMDLPVIMMSADGRTSAVMRGIKHGACDYLIKPVRLEELKNIWQHVVRKKWNGSRDLEQSGSVEETDRQKRGGDDIEYASSANEGTDGSWRVNKKRKDAKEEDDNGDLDNDDSSSSKKPRVVWSVELHQQFVSAVNQLGIDKAVPKRILELMNVRGLTRENVASHLQKFRLYLKRLSGVAQQGSGIPNMYYVPGEANVKLSGVDFEALAACGQIPAQTLAAIHAEVFGQPKQFLQASIIPGEDILSAVGTWMPNSLSTMSDLRPQLPLQQQQKHQSVFPESNRTISVQPSCVVVPSKFLSSQSHTNVWGQVPEGDTGEHCVPVSISSSCSAQADNISSWQVQMDSSTGQFQGASTWGVRPAYTSKRDQIGVQNLEFVGKGTTSVPSRFANDDFDGGFVKQEVILDPPENAKVGMPVIQHYSSSDLLLT